MEDQPQERRARKWRLPFSARARFLSVIILLFVVIAAMLLFWRPWQACKANCTVQVIGEATIKAEPDEYVFAPSYQLRKRDDPKALELATNKSEEVVKALKGLGVADSKIKSSVNGFDEYIREGEQSTVYTVSLTVTVTDKELAQKVQNYLVTTSPTGNVSPQANFSDSKRKALEQQARDEAIKDAKSKAERDAINLGFRLGSVKELSDSNGFGALPLMNGSEKIAVDYSGQGLGLQPGENVLYYTVNVTFFVK